MKFYVGLHQPSDARHFGRCMVSVNRLTKRFSTFAVKDWILDSGAFSRLTTRGEHMPMGIYANHIWRFSRCGNLQAAVCQDFMCEPFVLKKTGLSIREHQRLTIERYSTLCVLLQSVGCPTYVMPVLQGWEPNDYVRHLRTYDLRARQWVGVGSVCKRNQTDPGAVLAILQAVKQERPDLRLHGFGLKKTYLKHAGINHMLHSADSMAWSYAARRDPHASANDYREAQRFVSDIEDAIQRTPMPENIRDAHVTPARVLPCIKKPTPRIIYRNWL